MGEEKAAGGGGKKGIRRLIRMRRRHWSSCCVALSVLVILGALALAFYFRYRPRPPRVVATPVTLTVDELKLLPHPVLKLSIGVHVVVANPSQSPYRYGAALGPVTYHGAPVGWTLVPAGEIGGKSTRHIEPATVVDGVKVAENPHFAADAVAGALPFVAVVRVVGKALVLRAFEVPVTVEVVCFVRIYLFHGESSSRCVSTVRVGARAAAAAAGSGKGGYQAPAAGYDHQYPPPAGYEHEYPAQAAGYKHQYPVPAGYEHEYPASAAGYEQEYPAPAGYEQVYQPPAAGYAADGEHD